MSLGCGGPHGQGGCYAERLAIRWAGPGQPYEGLVRSTPAGPRWTGEIRFVEEALSLPLRWKGPRRIFVNSMSDLFHEKVEDEWIDRIFAVMALAPRHTFQILTKRPERMRAYCADMDRLGRAIWSALCRVSESTGRAVPFNALGGVVWPLPNIHLGVSVEDQATADERIPLLLQTPAAVRWVSYEPALGPVDYTPWLWPPQLRPGQPMSDRPTWRQLDWIVVGGESGPGARPFDVAWAEQAVEQCAAAGVPIYVKQLGSVPMMRESRWRAISGGGVTPTPMLSARNKGRVPEGFVPLHVDGKGEDWDTWPAALAHLKVREFPREGAGV